MRSKGLKRIITFILAIIMIVTFPLNAYAAEGNGTGDDTDNSGVHYVTGGASYQKAAYLIYIVDKNGNPITPIVEAAIDGCKEPPTDANFDYELSKFGNKAPTSFVTISGVPTPFTSGGDGNGALLKQALLKVTGTGTDGNNVYYAAEIIHKLFDNGSADNCKGFCYKFINSNEDQYLIFEGVYWLTMNNGSHSGETLVATATGWAKAQEAYGCGEYGSSTFSKYTNNIFPNCMKFQYTQLGYSPCPNGKQTNSVIMSSASGIISIWNNEIGADPGVQTTCDEYKNSPHKAPDESDGTFKIIKNYVTKKEDGSYTDDGCFAMPNVANEIYIEDESETTGYRLTGWKVSDSESEAVTSVNNGSLVWELNVPGTIKKSGNEVATVKVDELGGKSVYLLLEKEQETVEVGAGQFDISESSLTKKVRFSESSVTSKLLTHKFSWTSGEFSLRKCAGHKYTDSCKNTDTNGDGKGDACGGHTDYCSGFQFLDNNITVSLINEKVSQSKNVMVQIAGWENVVKNSSASSTTKYWHEFTRSLTTASTLSRSSWDYACVLWRGQDKLTVVQWKNSAYTNQLMRNIGFAVANTPQNNRKTSDFMSSFSAKFSEDKGSSAELTTKYGASKASKTSKKICTQTRDYAFKESTALSINNIQVSVRVYSGKSNLESSNINTELKQNQVEAGTVTFYPYIKMKYDTYNMTYTNDYGQTAYVFGNYARTLSLRNSFQVSFSAETDNSLEIVSNQWSTHATTMGNINKLFGTSNSVYKIIPGGAVIGIQNKYDSNSKKYITKDVNFITYQCILEGDGKAQVDHTGYTNGDFTEQLAKSRNNEAINSVVQGLKGVGLDLYGSTDATKEPFKGVNISEARKFDGSELSTDDKYNWDGDFSGLYLNAEAGQTSYEKYTFSCDTEGNIKMNDTTILTKGQGIESLTNSIAKNINDRTDVVTQLVNAIERNAGSDDSAIWAPDGTWYNEAFDGITVLVSKTPIHVGYWDTQVRNTVFDTKLTPYQGSKGDIGTKFYAFQMKTRPYSNLYPDEKNRLGSYMGEKIFSSVDLDKLYQTDKWYSSNITTSDLK